MYETIHLSNQEKLRITGCLYQPSIGCPPFPALVMCPGFAALKEHYQAYAHHLAQEGFVVLLYDPSHFGASQGLPRQAIDPDKQCQDYICALDYLRGHTNVDPHRIALWGSSLSGGHVLKLASEQIDIACVVAEVPFISGSANAARHLTLAQQMRQQRRFTKEWCLQQEGRSTQYVPVIDHSSSMQQNSKQPSLFSGEDAYRFFTQVSCWPNRVALLSIAKVAHYEPALFIDQIKVPTLIMSSEYDSINDSTLQRESFERMRCVKKFVQFPCNHFSPYLKQPPITHKTACQWLKQYCCM